MKVHKKMEEFSSLAQQNIVDWCLPHPFQCAVMQSPKLSICTSDGHKQVNLKVRRNVNFFNKQERAQRKYTTSKVIDRLNKEPANCPHIVKKY